MWKAATRLFDLSQAATVRAGSAVLFISHRMDEIAGLAHSVTVLRSGETTATLAIADASAEPADRHDFARRMTTDPRRPRARRPLDGATPVAAPPEPRLRAQGVVLRSRARPIDIEVRSGEIVGFSGLDGHGQADFLAALAGLNRPEAGTVETLRDGAWRPIASLREAVRNGVCYVPSDRKNEGLFLGLSVLDNYGLPTLWRDARLAFVDRAALRRRAERDLGVLHTRYSRLSGRRRAALGRQSAESAARALARHRPCRDDSGRSAARGRRSDQGRDLRRFSRSCANAA